MEDSWVIWLLIGIFMVMVVAIIIWIAIYRTSPGNIDNSNMSVFTPPSTEN